VAGDALPFAVFQNPGIGEAAKVIVRFAVVRTFGVINAGHHAGVVIQVHFHILDGDQVRFELGVFDIGEKFAALADFAVPFRVRERIGDHAFQCALVAVHLSIVPKVLEDDQLGRLRIVSIVSRLREGSQCKKKAAEDCVEHVH